MKKAGFSFALIIIFGLLIGQVVFGGAYGDPGSEDDPIISKSYIYEVLVPELEQKFEEMLKDYEKEDEAESEEEAEERADGEGALDTFEIVELDEGDRFVAGESTEIISRTGEGEIIDSPSGGISDLTGGEDLAGGMSVPQNHHLLVPRDDGRGIEAETYMILLVRGQYEINS